MFHLIDPNSERSYSPRPATARTPWKMIILVAIIAGVIGAITGASIVLLQLPEEHPPTMSAVSEVLPTRMALETRTISLNVNSAVTDAVELVAPGVVTVLSNLGSQNGFLGDSFENFASGSGVFISPDGYLVTNQHVVDGTRGLAVIFSNGEQRTAELVGEDPYDDLAILHVEGEIPAYVELGNSDMLKPGETVIAIGSPLGTFQNSVTVGVVSATDRTMDVSETYEIQEMIQTDAAINQGNSGGPLINLDGQIIGINTLIIRGSNGTTTAEGLGFAIPSNTVRAVSTQLINRGYISRPYLGVRWGWITPAIARRYSLPVEYGVFLTEVIDGGPGQEAGLEVDNIIIAINEVELDDQHPFTNVLFEFEPGDEISLTVLQDGELRTLSLTLGELTD